MNVRRRSAPLATLRFAHPFFTPTPPDQRPLIPALGARRASEFAQSHLGPIPPPRRDAVMELKDIIGKPGTDEIQAAGEIRFQATGDTGRPQADNKHQEDVTDAMSSEFHPTAGAKNPAFLLHLGDVIYGHRKALLFRDEFYRPYMKYPGKIMAIAGNHDGEIFQGTDPKPLAAFLDNFCASSAVVPPIASNVGIFRQTMTQPGVFWLLRAPFVRIIGLYSNVAEGPGQLLGKDNDDKQIKWLTKTLAAIKKEEDRGDRRALVIATHHPPFSAGGHSGSPAMLGQIDKACQAAGILPHAMLAGHAHNYQRYTRGVKLGSLKGDVPYLVAGCGGHNDSTVVEAHGQKVDDATFEKSRKGFGYLAVSATATKLVIEMFDTTGGGRQRFDTVTVTLAAHRVS